MANQHRYIPVPISTTGTTGDPPMLIFVRYCGTAGALPRRAPPVIFGAPDPLGPRPGGIPGFLAHSGTGGTGRTLPLMNHPAPSSITTMPRSSQPSDRHIF